MSLLAALSSPLTIAVCTEFSVLFIERYHEERRVTPEPDTAITAASTSIGRAFTVSGLTIATAFGVVALSGFPLLASFGAVVAVNVVAAMICALTILRPSCALRAHASVLKSIGPIASTGDLRLRDLLTGTDPSPRRPPAWPTLPTIQPSVRLTWGSLFDRRPAGAGPPATHHGGSRPPG